MTLKIETFRKIARKMGVKRISDDACRLLAQYCEEYAVELIQRADMFSKHAKRKTILDCDIQAAKKIESKSTRG